MTKERKARFEKLEKDTIALRHELLEIFQKEGTPEQYELEKADKELASALVRIINTDIHNVQVVKK